MKHLNVLALILSTFGGIASAQDVARDEIRRVPVPGSKSMEVIVMQLTVPPGATIPRHSHPGDEHAVVISQTTARTPDGTVVNFEPGQTLYFPDGVVHGGLTNAGDTDMVAITTFVVRVGEPLVVLAEE